MNPSLPIQFFSLITPCCLPFISYHPTRSWVVQKLHVSWGSPLLVYECQVYHFSKILPSLPSPPTSFIGEKQVICSQNWRLSAYKAVPEHNLFYLWLWCSYCLWLPADRLSQQCALKVVLVLSESFHSFLQVQFLQTSTVVVRPFTR